MLKHHEIYSRLEENKDILKQYLIKQNWTIKEMTGYEWVINPQYKWHMYGKITDNNFRDSKGIKITSVFVDISHFNRGGELIRPFIRCDRKRFEIYE